MLLGYFMMLFRLNVRQSGYICQELTTFVYIEI